MNRTLGKWNERKCKVNIGIHDISGECNSLVIETHSHPLQSRFSHLHCSALTQSRIVEGLHKTLRLENETLDPFRQRSFRVLYAQAQLVPV